jgi:hypothetical protein
MGIVIDMPPRGRPKGEIRAVLQEAIEQTLDATVDGTKYAGTFSQGATVGFGTGVSGTSFATGTAISSNGSGQAILTSADGKVIQCVFQASLGRGQGQCEGMDGRRFVLVIGG